LRDEVNEDARIFGIKNSWILAQDRDKWNGFLEEAKTQG